MKSVLASLIALTLTANVFAESSQGSPKATAAFLKNAQNDGLKFNGVGNIFAGHYGLLIVAENDGLARCYRYPPHR